MYSFLEKHFEKDVMTKEDEESFESSTKCWICDNTFVKGVVKLRDPCHVTGNFRDAWYRDWHVFGTEIDISHNDYPLALDKSEVKRKTLSDYKLNIGNVYKILLIVLKNEFLTLLWRNSKSFITNFSNFIYH